MVLAYCFEQYYFSDIDIHCQTKVWDEYDFMSFKEVSSAQGYIYLIKNTGKK